ncbi:hypothetical protein ILYODFUR_009584 [Ilyodon furcidens]|uniref:Uncharacterized protein n=1 Tax=Ilyodon furcidens TaxID=33524 RepID=A0ABV0UEQ4_9TELE
MEAKFDYILWSLTRTGKDSHREFKTTPASLDVPPDWKTVESHNCNRFVPHHSPYVTQQRLTHKHASKQRLGHMQLIRPLVVVTRYYQSNNFPDSPAVLRHLGSVL